MTLTEEQIAGRSPLRLKIVEVGRSDGPPDFLIADEDVSEVSVMMGTVAVYAQVADRRTAEIIVKSVHEYLALLPALEAANKRADEAEARRKCYECGSEMTACARCNPELPTAELTALRARVAELEGCAIDTAASLAAAISLLERGGNAAKKAAPSDKMFDLMLTDYRKSLSAVRAALKGASHEQG